MDIRRFWIFFIIIVLLSLISVYWPKFTGEVIKTEYEVEYAVVEEVIDGDTIELIDGSRVRLLGINTPEKGKNYYIKAKEFLSFLEGEEVGILRDYEDLDRYGRKLRYVYYGNRFLNVEILQNGLATSFMINGLIYEDKLITGERFAIENEIGLWEKSDDVCGLCIELIELNYKDEYFDIRNNCNFDCHINKWVVKDDANHFVSLYDLKALEIRRYESKNNIWNNDGDRFFMRDSEGKLVVYYAY